MTIRDEKLLAEFRGQGPCEICGRSCQVREAAHCFAVGRGGANRLDVSFNLLSLGSSRHFICPCHASQHACMARYFTKFAGRAIATADDIQWFMLDRIAEREKLAVDDIRDVICLILRLDKHASQDRLLMAADELATDAAKVLYTSTLRKAGKMQ